MLKTLILKQFRECFRSYFVNPKTGKSRSKGGIAGMFVLFAVVMVFLCAMFFGMSFLVGDALLGAGMEWLYFVLMGVLSMLLGTFGSVFNTYSTLYLAKDNEMLLSMPIPPSRILMTRMTLVYGLSLLYSGVVWLPAVVYYWIFAKAAAVVYDVLLLFLVALLVTVVSCALGWVVALIASRVKNKSILTVLITLVFLGGYYYVCFNLTSMLQSLLRNAAALGEGIRTWANLLYQLGQAATGKTQSLLLFAAVTLVLFGVCFFVLSRSFLHITTRSRGERKKQGALSFRSSNLSTALLKRELSRFVSSPTYLLNCGLGVVILPVLAVLALLKREVLDGTIAVVTQMLPWVGGMVPMVVVLLVCLCSGLNAVSTPSISLEGKHLWILRSLPVTGKMVLGAKLRLHLWVNLPVGILAVVLLSLSLKLQLLTLCLCTLLVTAFIFVTGSFGLILGLLRPNFQWTSEAMPIKQSMNMIVSILIGFALPILLALGAYLTRNLFSLEVYLGLSTALLAVIGLGLKQWLNTVGDRKFDALTSHA